MPQQKKGRQTCWSFLLILLTLVALVELGKGLRCLLDPRHKDFNVIQSTVEDLLRETRAEVLAGDEIRSGSDGLRISHHILLDALGQFLMGLCVMLSSSICI